MISLFRGFIRASSFIRKEIYEVLRQPRLILTLVLGPFLILFLFGLGYTNRPRMIRAWVVAQPDSALAQDIEQYAKEMESQLTILGISNNIDDGFSRLHNGDVELVIVTPENAYDTILDNKRAVFTLYHNEIDPVQVSYVEYLGVVFEDIINQGILLSITTNGQKETTNLYHELQSARQNISDLRAALNAGDESAALKGQQALNQNIDAVSMGLNTSLGLLNSIRQTTGSAGSQAAQLQQTLKDLQQNTAQLNQGEPGAKDQRLGNIDKIDQDLSNLDNFLSSFQQIDPRIIISPFRSEAKSIAAVHPTQSNFFAPAVLALLLQHIAVTFCALSIVRERYAGALELFRVSPISAGEILFGKYAGFMLLGGLIAAILTGVLVFVLHIPMLGNWAYYALVIVVLLFTSMGIGFTISMISQTDSQAVQYSMIVLLASVFFSGFIANLDYFSNPVKLISWLLPTTYGSTLLRNISLRGAAPDWLVLGGLATFGLVLMVISWLLMRNQISTGRRMQHKK